MKKEGTPYCENHKAPLPAPEVMRYLSATLLQLSILAMSSYR